MPPTWLVQLDALDATLTRLAASEFPELARPDRRNPVLVFALTNDGTAMARVLGVRCHLMLGRKAHQLVQGGTVDLHESLRAQITPLKVARGFAWESLSPLDRLSTWPNLPLAAASLPFMPQNARYACPPRPN